MSESNELQLQVTLSESEWDYVVEKLCAEKYIEVAEIITKIGAQVHQQREMFANDKGEKETPVNPGPIKRPTKPTDK